MACPHHLKVPCLMILCNYKFVNASVKAAAAAADESGSWQFSPAETGRTPFPGIRPYSSLLMLGTMCGTAAPRRRLCRFMCV